jgi:hypothetical protein
MFHHAGGGETALIDWPGQVWGATDTDFSWETTDVSTYLGSDGTMSIEWCGCYQNSNNYDVSHDVMRIRLELAQ